MVAERHVSLTVGVAGLAKQIEIVKVTTCAKPSTLQCITRRMESDVDRFSSTRDTFLDSYDSEHDEEVEVDWADHQNDLRKDEE